MTYIDRAERQLGTHVMEHISRLVEQRSGDNSENYTPQMNRKQMTSAVTLLLNLGREINRESAF